MNAARVAACLSLFALANCEPPVETSASVVSATSEAHYGLVRLGTQDAPEGAREIGVVQAHSDQTAIDRIMPAFVQKVAALGGNYAKIDDITTRYEWHMMTQTQSYSCGTSTSPQTCTRTVTSNVEVPTTRVLGRAFEVK